MRRSPVQPKANSEPQATATVDGELKTAASPGQRLALVNSQGVRYLDFRKSLRPRYRVVWAQILGGHLGLATLIVLALLIPADAVFVGALATLLIAALLGLCHSYIHNFFHEATHFNLAADRARNDLLANLFIGSLVGQNIANYRRVHFDHHKFLGTTRDTERTYFEPLDARFLLESITGIRAVRVLLGREQRLDQTQVERHARWPLLLGLTLHAAVVGSAAVAHAWFLVAAWILGLAVFFPFFSGLRQLLEHRSEAAASTTDYALVDHGETNRMFRAGPLAAIIGSAGFTRHLLHHWDPQVSCTRLGDVERFLGDTELAATLAANRTSYLETFRRLYTTEPRK